MSGDVSTIGSAADTHLHWRRTGKATWQLHLAFVRNRPAHFVGCCRLSVFHATARVLANGTIRYRIDWAQHDTYDPGALTRKNWEWGALRKPLTPVGHPEIEQAFMAKLGARALQGERERLSQNSVQEVCATCPPTVQVRIDSARREKRARDTWGDWLETAFNLDGGPFRAELARALEERDAV